MEIGESFIGEGANAAHVNTVLGHRDGPVGTAWATALATPRAGHTPFVAVIRPGLPARPFTLFVNKAAIENDEHARLTCGAAQAGIAGGVADAVTEGVMTDSDAAALILIAAVWVDPEADDEEAVYRNNREAVCSALRAGRHGEPVVEATLTAANVPWNPFFHR